MTLPKKQRAKQNRRKSERKYSHISKHEHTYIEGGVCAYGCHVYVCAFCLCVCAIKITLFASCNFIELEEHTLPKVFTQLANLSRQKGGKGGEEERGGER